VLYFGYLICTLFTLILTTKLPPPGANTTDITIKELAEELGLTKQAIRQHLKTMPSNLQTKKDGNTILLPPEVVAYIIERTHKKRKPQDDTSTKALIQQITEKDRQIQKLQQLLDQQQKLTLQSNNRAEQLEKELKKIELHESEDVSEVIPP